MGKAPQVRLLRLFVCLFSCRRRRRRRPLLPPGRLHTPAGSGRAASMAAGALPAAPRPGGRFPGSPLPRAGLWLPASGCRPAPSTARPAGSGGSAAAGDAGGGAAAQPALRARGGSATSAGGGGGGGSSPGPLPGGSRPSSPAEAARFPASRRPAAGRRGRRRATAAEREAKPKEPETAAEPAAVGAEGSVPMRLCSLEGVRGSRRGRAAPRSPPAGSRLCSASGSRAGRGRPPALRQRKASGRLASLSSAERRRPHGVKSHGLPAGETARLDGHVASRLSEERPLLLLSFFRERAGIALGRWSAVPPRESRGGPPGPVLLAKPCRRATAAPGTLPEQRVLRDGRTDPIPGPARPSLGDPASRGVGRSAKDWDSLGYAVLLQSSLQPAYFVCVYSLLVSVLLAGSLL